MLSYKIISRQQSTKAVKSIDENSPEFKERIISRILSRIKYNKGDRLRIVGTNKKGIVTKIHYGMENIRWEKSKPFFIEMLLDDGEVLVCSPYDLTRKKL
jgi:hypothetical protein